MYIVHDISRQTTSGHCHKLRKSLPIAKQSKQSQQLQMSSKFSAQRHTRHMSHKTTSMKNDTLKYKTTAISSVQRELKLLQNLHVFRRCVQYVAVSGVLFTSGIIFNHPNDDLKLLQVYFQFCSASSLQILTVCYKSRYTQTMFQRASVNNFVHSQCNRSCFILRISNRSGRYVSENVPLLRAIHTLKNIKYKIYSISCISATLSYSMQSLFQ